YGMSPSQIMTRIKEVAEQFNFKHLLDRDIFNLSGGEKQLLACSSIQVYGHELIILEEPSSNLDFNTIFKIQQMIKIWKNEGKTIIIAEHRLHYLTEVADRFIIMKDGKISEIYENEQFNALSNKQLASLGLRNIHLEQLNVKVKHNNKLGYLNLKNYYFKYKRRQKLALNIDDVNISKGKVRSEEHTSELQSRFELVCRLLLEK